MLPPPELLRRIRTCAPHAHESLPSPHQVSYHLKSKETVVVEEVLKILDVEKHIYGIASYDVLGTTIEDIFLDLMDRNDPLDDEKESQKSAITSVLPDSISPLELSNGRATSPFQQAATIFYKRALIFRRSWLTLVLAVLVAVAGSTIPLVFITGRQASCVKTFSNSTSIPLYLPTSPILPFLTLGASTRIQESPPGIISTLGTSTRSLRIHSAADNATFVTDINQNYQNLSYGGVSIDLQTGSSLVAWEATSPGLTGPTMLNLATNILYNNARNSSGIEDEQTIIRANYQSFPAIAAGTFFALKWVAFFGAAMVCCVCSRPYSR